MFVVGALHVGLRSRNVMTMIVIDTRVVADAEGYHLQELIITVRRGAQPSVYMYM